MTLEYSTILMVALKAIPCLDMKDEDCRKVARAQKLLPRDEKELLDAIMPSVINLYGRENLDDEEEIVYAKSILWDALDYLMFLQRSGIEVVGCLDPLYPKQLRYLEDFPVLLYVKGNVSLLGNPDRLAIVGTREPSQYGKKVARRLGAYFAEKGFTVVSGLAKGCDTEAHWGCIEAGGKTVAVLAHGLDMVYPEENADLAKAIIAKGGCLVSEYIPPDQPSPQTIIERDRIQAALAKGVIVVESETHSGAMHTARFALQLVRKLGCMGYYREVPEAKMAGNNELVDSGEAVRLVDAQDMEEFFKEIIW
jgi:DNA processing protein